MYPIELEPARRGHQGKAGKREVGGLATERRYTDSRVDEQKRGLSIKSAPVSLLLQSSTEKHYLFNLIDTPGHVGFQDEVANQTAALTPPLRQRPLAGAPPCCVVTLPRLRRLR